MILDSAELIYFNSYKQPFRKKDYFGPIGEKDKHQSLLVDYGRF